MVKEKLERLADISGNISKPLKLEMRKPPTKKERPLGRNDYNGHRIDSILRRTNQFLENKEYMAMA
ncbi:hypothetical protein GOV13_03945 [Candidatus Pacearchaeota archaeon]|nr:hypothetical protein [Candidatus Pacearchaeota archaeon]